ncbi:EAL domain-containing protein [Pseudomonas chlororaphis subsp. piscium]
MSLNVHEQRLTSHQETSTPDREISLNARGVLKLCPKRKFPSNKGNFPDEALPFPQEDEQVFWILRSVNSMPVTLPLRVMVIDDHAFQRSVTTNMLRQAGCYEVFDAAGGEQALALLYQIGHIDVAIFDLRMQDMDGLEFVQHAGASGLVDAVIIGDALTADMRRAIRQITGLHGLEFLGDISKPFQNLPLERLLLGQLNASSVPRTSPPVVELASESEVRQALFLEQLQPYFQPKFNLRTGDVASVEVLARWDHPEKGILPPSVFIPVLERCGLMEELLASQLHAGLKLQKQAWERGYSINLAFNLETRQLSNQHFTARIRSILADRSMPGSGLTFELTESGLLEISATTLENLVRLRLMGCGLSIDDFGAGFSSLQRLCQLPFNEIKLDAEFVRGLNHEPRCRAVIVSTLALGETLGMSVVVEGIETEAQREALLELGCTLGQGYVCAKPMAGSEFLGWLEKRFLASCVSSMTQ